MDAASRVREAFVDASRRRALGAERGEVVALDGIAMMFTNLADESLNGGIAFGSPADPAAMIETAGEMATGRGQPLGLEVERGRFP